MAKKAPTDAACEDRTTRKPRRATRSEASLVRGFCSRLDGFLNGRGPWGVKREVAVGRSVADVVIFLDVSEESRSHVEPLGTAECVFLARLRRGDGLPAVRTDSRTAMILDRLCARDLVTLTDDGGASLTGASYSGDVIAVEAKLRRWREALDQAVQYKRFADYSYVVLPVELASAARQNSSHFEDAGIGLLLLERDDISEAIPAAKNEDHDWRREFVCSRLGGVRWFV